MRAPGLAFSRGPGGLQWVALLLSAVGGFVLGPRLEQRAIPVVAALAGRVPPPGLTGLWAAPVPWPGWRELADRLLAGAQRAAVPAAGTAAASRATADVAPDRHAATRRDRPAEDGVWQAQEGSRQPPVAATAPALTSLAALAPGREPAPGPVARPEPPSDVQAAGRMVPSRLPGLRRPAVRVAIYHTHTSEMYRRPDFQPQRGEAYHRFGTTDTGVVRVGQALAEALNALGVPTLHVATIHDYPDHGAAYARSERTVRMLLERYPDLVLMLDIHRDAPQEGGGLVTSVEGEDVARVALVVGTGPDGTEGAANLAVARRLAAVAEQHLPGLMRRIITVPGRRYNEHLHPGVLVVEVGSYLTREAAALRTARLLAPVVAEVVMELVHGDGRPGPLRHIPPSPLKGPAPPTTRGG